MTGRWPGIGVVAAALVAGLGFAPVFSLLALLPSLLAVVAVVLAVDVVVARWPRLGIARYPVALLGGAVAGSLALTLPSWDPRPVLTGARSGWLRTLESTLPARAEPELMAFVPLLVLLAAAIGLEWLRRGIGPLVSLAPSAIVLVIAQLYSAASGGAAIALACGYGVAAALVLGVGRVGRPRDLLLVALPVAAVASASSAVLGLADPLGAPTFSLNERLRVADVPDGAANPLAQLGDRLTNPDEIAFTATTDAAVDRWPLVVLDGFDGVGFTSSARYRPLGAELAPDPAVTVPTEIHEAGLAPAPGLDGPWLPTRFRPTVVEGITPAVDPVTGTILLTDDPAPYALTWREPALAPDDLVDAPVDPDAPTLEVTDVPAGVVEATAVALGGAAPSFPAALALEQWFQDNYTLADGAEIPTGHGTAQILFFLDESKRGTSEQFATAYALAARTAGIPVRLVVGFRQPQPEADGSYVVRNRDAFAWPEVAVDGVGWVALDPTGGAQSSEAPGSVSQAANAARDQLPESDALAAPQPVGPPAPSAAPVAAPSNGLMPVLVGAGVVVAGLLAWLLGVPAAKRVRRVRRRRGEPGQAVVGAWLETRDRLRDHGVPVRSGMTVRDAAAPAAPVLDGSGAEIARLAWCVDAALWSGTAVDRATADDAWAASAAIDRALAGRPVADRVRAAIRLRTMTGPPP